MTFNVTRSTSLVHGFSPYPFFGFSYFSNNRWSTDSSYTLGTSSLQSKSKSAWQPGGLLAIIEVSGASPMAKVSLLSGLMNMMAGLPARETEKGK